jgi:hypothetical protein
MFKRKKKPETVSDQAAGVIAGFLVWIQQRFAEWMGRKTSDFGRGGKITLLVMVVIVFGGLSVGLLVNVFTNPPEGSDLKPAQVRVPKYDKKGDASVNEIAIVSLSAYIKMRAFRRYMDSLQKTAAGKSTYDSIIKARPGLMDSVLFLEELYRSQQNGKNGK